MQSFESCNSLGHIAAACLPTASIRALEGKSGQNSKLAVEYPLIKQQQQQQQKQATQVNYIQTFPSFQSTYPSRGRMVCYIIGQCRGKSAKKEKKQ